ncbi:MAG: hypothetical protein ABW174_10715 [Flavitalea sp.]
MKHKSTLAAIGGYQPFLFCIGMYFVALFFSIFICSAIFYAINPKKAPVTAKVEDSRTKDMVTSSSQVMLSVTK